jgi:hypothetical protein
MTGEIITLEEAPALRGAWDRDCGEAPTASVGELIQRDGTA